MINHLSRIIYEQEFIAVRTLSFNPLIGVHEIGGPPITPACGRDLKLSVQM